MMINENERQVGKKAKKEFLAGVVCSNPGRAIAPVYKRVFDENTKRNVVNKVDETNLDEFIQASKAQTDLAILQKRFLELGEIPAADETLGSNDLTIFPDNIHDVYKMVNDIDSNFNRLPESVRNIFGTKEAYMKSLLDGTYQATLVNAFNAQKVEKVDDKKEGNE